MIDDKRQLLSDLLVQYITSDLEGKYLICCTICSKQSYELRFYQNRSEHFVASR